MFDTFKKGSGGRYVWDEGKRQLVKLEDVQVIDPNHGLNGPVYCPDKGYFDLVLNRRFESASEKRSYMREHGLMMHSGGKKQTEGNPGKTFYFIPGLSRNNRYYKHR